MLQLCEACGKDQERLKVMQLARKHGWGKSVFWVHKTRGLRIRRSVKAPSLIKVLEKGKAYGAYVERKRHWLVRKQRCRLLSATKKVFTAIDNVKSSHTTGRTIRDETWEDAPPASSLSPSLASEEPDHPTPFDSLFADVQSRISAQLSFTHPVTTADLELPRPAPITKWTPPPTIWTMEEVTGEEKAGLWEEIVRVRMEVLKDGLEGGWGAWDGRVKVEESGSRGGSRSEGGGVGRGVEEKKDEQERWRPTVNAFKRGFE